MSGFNLSALAVRERSITLFLLIMLAAAGAFAFLALGRAEDPPFTIKILTVSATWPGATAREMQDQVADPLEKRLQELRYYDRVETFTRPGVMLMTVFLKDTAPPAQVPEDFIRRGRNSATKPITCRRVSSAPSSTTNMPISISPSTRSTAQACRNAFSRARRKRCASACCIFRG
jgi:multidrug efflux pump subunit AcrB